MEEHTNADENFSLSATQLLSLAQRAADIFESSEVEEKRQLINFVFQNLTTNKKKLNFQLRKPFEALVSYADHPALLPDLDSNQGQPR